MKYLPLIISIIIVVIIAGAFSILKDIQKKKNLSTFPYIKRNVLTNTELAFFKVLVQCVPIGNLLFAKVRLWDFIKVNSTVNKTSHENRIRAKHIDFLLCNLDSTPVLAIELDDSSHNLQKRQQRDNFVNNALGNAGIKILHIKTATKYDNIEISKAIIEMMNNS